MKRLIHTFIFLITLLSGKFFLEAEEYQFSGTHYMASYIDCDHKALCDFVALRQAMESAVEESGATLLTGSEHIFPPEAITLVLLLSESHASIHTYPEHNSCYVDLFTCGDTCDYREFEKVMYNYLKPRTIESDVLKR